MVLVSLQFPHLKNRDDTIVGADVRINEIMDLSCLAQCPPRGNGFINASH